VHLLDLPAESLRGRVRLQKDTRMKKKSSNEKPRARENSGPEGF
jgi:hypothetical protein